MEPIEAEVYNYPIKKQNSKTQFTTFTEQHKFKKNKDFYKAEKLRKYGFNDKPHKKYFAIAICP